MTRHNWPSHWMPLTHSQTISNVLSVWTTHIRCKANTFAHYVFNEMPIHFHLSIFYGVLIHLLLNKSYFSNVTFIGQFIFNRCLCRIDLLRLFYFFPPSVDDFSDNYVHWVRRMTDLFLCFQLAPRDFSNPPNFSLIFAILH